MEVFLSFDVISVFSILFVKLLLFSYLVSSLYTKISTYVLYLYIILIFCILCIFYFIYIFIFCFSCLFYGMSFIFHECNFFVHLSEYISDSFLCFQILAQSLFPASFCLLFVCLGLSLSCLRLSSDIQELSWFAHI